MKVRKREVCSLVTDSIVSRCPPPPGYRVQDARSIDPPDGDHCEWQKVLYLESPESCILHRLAGWVGLHCLAWPSGTSNPFLQRARFEAERYGTDPWVFVRELLQNARDAGARRVWFQTSTTGGVNGSAVETTAPV